jgi:hypothetical protein
MRNSSIFSGISHLIAISLGNYTPSCVFFTREKFRVSPHLELIFHKKYFIMKDAQRDKPHSQYALNRHLEQLNFKLYPLAAKQSIC